jgi:hypothetical protein
LHGAGPVAQFPGEPNDFDGTRREVNAFDVSGPTENIIEFRKPYASVTERFSEAMHVIATICPRAEVIPDFICREELVEQIAPIQDNDELLHADRPVAIEVERGGMEIEGLLQTDDAYVVDVHSPCLHFALARAH